MVKIYVLSQYSLTLYKQEIRNMYYVVQGGVNAQKCGVPALIQSQNMPNTLRMVTNKHVGTYCIGYFIYFRLISLTFSA